MILLPEHIELLFFKTLKGETPIRDFEHWLYTNKELEGLISEDEYLDFISLSYKASGASHELAKLLRKHIDLGKYETWKLMNLLSRVTKREGDYVAGIINFYDLYCKGYYFLDCLAFQYGLPLDSDTYRGSKRKLEVANRFYPAIEADIERVLDLLNSGRIRITGEADAMGYLRFADSRSKEEIQEAAYWKTPVPAPKTALSVKKWWQFWN